MQVALLSARLAAAARGARPPAPSAAQAPQPAPAPPEAPLAPVNPVFEDLEVAHASGQHDAGSAAAETYLRDLAGRCPSRFRSVR